MERPRDPFIVALDLDERGRLMAVAEVGWTGGAVRATLKLARLAGECGLHGVVASAREARAYAARARRARTRRGRPRPAWHSPREPITSWWGGR